MDFLALLLFLIPIYIANSSPVILGGGIAIDLGEKFFDKKRILGKGKTVRGFLAGVACGTVAGVLIAMIYPLEFFSSTASQMMGAFAVSLGTMAGDSFGSFLKRRFSIASGKPFIVDTVLFLAVALVFVYPFAEASLYTLENILFMFTLTVIMHPTANLVANKMGLKNVPW